MLLAIEGPDGVGKTTLAEKLRKEFENAEVVHFPTNEFFDDEIFYKEYPNDEILAMFFAIDKLMKYYNDLTKDKVFILDRYKLSAYAYQQVDTVFIDMINRSLPDPDVLIYLTASSSFLEKRLKTRGLPLNRFERMSIEYDEYFDRFNGLKVKYNVEHANNIVDDILLILRNKF